MPPNCSLCEHDYQSKTGTWKDLVLDHYKEDHMDLMLIFDWLVTRENDETQSESRINYEG